MFRTQYQLTREGQIRYDQNLRWSLKYGMPVDEYNQPVLTDAVFDRVPDCLGSLRPRKEPNNV